MHGGIHAGAAKVITDIAKYAFGKGCRPPADPHFHLVAQRKNAVQNQTRPPRHTTRPMGAGRLRASRV